MDLNAIKAKLSALNNNGRKEKRLTIQLSSGNLN